VTDSGEITARKIVLTQGAWLGATLQKLDVSLELTVRKEQYLFFKALAANEFVTGRFPIFCEYNALGDDLDIQFYGFPIFENRSAMKMAFHQTGPITSAERRNFAIEEDRKQQLISFVERRFPEKFGEVVDGKTCLYTNTADRDFVFDFLPGRTDILVLSACSGHGFKFAPLFGKMAERLLRSEGHDDPLEVFSIERFAGIPR
ncbi:MAG TPA: FAD-dependent oxidoreductase, partial [Candidatus Obscuribacterales bacterium]